MDDRKRPAIGSADDLAPPSKRQAVNGGGKSKDDSGDTKEEAWIDDFAKGAIYRQMQEYKREKATLETRLEELARQSADHDDHIRFIDAWWQQLVQEVELLADTTISTQPTAKDAPPFLSNVMFQDISDFKRHLADISKGIKVKLEALFARLASHRGQISPKAAELEGKITALLAAQKEFMIRLDRMSSEKEQLSEQLNTATFRYVKAEKRLDRARSVQVQKMEQQAIANATARPSNDQAENGVDEGESNGDNKVLLAQYEEARALVEKQKEQRDAALDQARKLQEELTSVKIRLTGLSDEDYARSDVFKAFKAQNEDLIKRINHLEATNKQLREEAEKFQSERTAFRSQLEREAHAVAMELEDQIQQRDQDLTRIRSARDELFADLSQRKASLEQERTAMEHVRELLAAKEDRIVALELAVERINPTSEPMAQDRPDLDELSLEELRERFIKLELDFDSINKEMPSIEKAYKKAMALSHKKVMDFASLEERVSILIAEKGKADQKYFAARKDMDTRLAEVRALRHQNAKSSEIIQQLKDVEAQSRTLVSNLEKQLTDLKSASSTAMSENRRLEATATESVRKVDSLKQQVENLSGLLKQKDVHNHAITEDKMSVEAELEQLRARIEHVQKDRDSWKTKCQSNSTEEEDLLRKFALCAICRSNFKNTVLRTCGHIFCKDCVDDRIANRMRKCPNCGKAFDKLDVMPAHM